MSAEPVILIHGLWMAGAEMTLLGSRLADAGFATTRFRYPSTQKGILQHADALAEAVRQNAGPRAPHLVCHSLGGLVAVTMLQRHPELPVGRVVALGSPLRGSWMARRLARHGWGARMLGFSYESALKNGVKPPVPVGIEMGSIAGTLSVIGANKIFRGLPEPSDGTVSLAETHLEGVADHATVRATHMGLLLSTTAAEQTEWFLRGGSFAE
ncbi:putative PGAP1 family protein [Magnetofaba australis IT-1]|uniref:Putative PGAP1 family protein n=2 Tax=Magnetofaba TaxID=1472292 RepID=A0A1Y2K8V9_9PROT|nr:putative PGAP1 family protein [Magnetofaba australis IT-1]